MVIGIGNGKRKKIISHRFRYRLKITAHALILNLKKNKTIAKKIKKTYHTLSESTAILFYVLVDPKKNKTISVLFLNGFKYDPILNIT